MKRILLSSFLISTLSLWSAARPQTAVEVARPQTAVEVNRPQTLEPLQRPVTTVEINRPVTQSSAVRGQTTVQTAHPQTTVEINHPATTLEVLHPATTVEVVHPQTAVEVVHPQTVDFSAGEEPGNRAFNAGQKVGKSGAVSSAQAATSMSNFTPKQAKDFAALQKAAPVGGGDNKLGNETNVAEKDAANKASLLGKQSNQNIDVDPNAKLSNLAGLNKAVEKQVNEKKKK